MHCNKAGRRPLEKYPRVIETGAFVGERRATGEDLQVIVGSGRC